MLYKSFFHIPTIGAATEKKIWNCGICSMDDFLDSPPDFISSKKKELIFGHIELSKEKIKNNDPVYFVENLPSKEHWRIFNQYRNSSVYLDIETTGLDFYHSHITSIAMYDGRKIKYYVYGRNLDDFVNDIKDYKVIITYNGKSFDIPFIEKFFNISLNHAHLDLRHILKSLGFSGGLKSCERQFGIGRKDLLGDVDGFFAVELWNDYIRRKNAKALETLLSYNIEDVLNLEYLMVEAYNRKILDTPAQNSPVFHGKKPLNPFKIDRETMAYVSRVVSINRFS
jgi:uncharacterized protein YprB with RNaseH-like and TPR domain